LIGFVFFGAAAVTASDSVTNRSISHYPAVLTVVAAMIETMPLERAPEAYAKILAGKARFRMVLIMQS
jgi:D-arabinose 1-dehydrogenase-like Zn-dependent alcohol dehydrogenase